MRTLAFLLLLAGPARAETNDIFVAIQRNDVKNVTALLQANPALAKAVSPVGGITPLHQAAFPGNVEIIKLLLANRADINAKDTGNIETPLHRCLMSNKKEIVELFLANGADVNAKRRDGGTSLHAAIQRCQKDIVALLLAKKANPNIADTANGFTPLLMAVAYRSTVIRYKGSYTDALKQTEIDYQAIAQMLLDAGANINAKSRDGKTPLKLAIERKRPEMEAFLRGKGAIE